MRIDIDLDYNRAVAAPGTRDPISQLIFKRDTAAELSIYFWKNNARVALPDDATGKFGIKAKGKFDGTLLVFAETWTQTGTGADAIYTFEPAFNGETLAALLFSGDGNENNDVETIEGIAEIKWMVSGKKNRTQTIPVIIQNDVLKDDDGTPLALPSPSEWLIGNTAPVNWPTGYIVFNAAGGSSVADGDYIEIITGGTEIPNERWIFRDVADPQMLEIQIQSSWDDTIYIFAQQMTLRSQIMRASFSIDAYERPVITFTPKIYADYYNFTINDWGHGITIDSSHPAGGIMGTDAPPFIRVANGYLYIQDSGVWKKRDLTAL